MSGSGASPTTFTYYPDSNFNGSDSFEVQVSDGALTDTIIINVTVTAVDDALIIMRLPRDLRKTVAEDGPAS